MLTSWMRVYVRGRGGGGQPPCPALGMLQERGPRRPLLWLAAIFPHTGALPPLISVVAGMHCCLFVVLLRED